MAKKKDKYKPQTNYSQKGKGVNWDLVWKVLASAFAFAGSLATVYDLVGKIRSDAQTFYSFVIPGLAFIIWLIVLIQLIRKRNPYVILLLAVTVLGGIVGGIGWYSIKQSEESKLIILIVRFDGPEEVYGLQHEIIDNLNSNFRNDQKVKIIGVDKIITPSDDSNVARKLGNENRADIVIWGWYRPTQNPNVTIHIENLNPNQLLPLEESEVVNPSVSLADLESFTFQQQAGQETSTLISFLSGFIQYRNHNYQLAIHDFNQALSQDDLNTKLFSNRAEVLFYKATSNLFLQNYSQSILDYNQAAMLDDGRDASIYINRAAAYISLGHYEQSIQDYDEAIKFENKQFLAYYGRGVAYIYLKDFNNAIKDFDQAIELESFYAPAYSNRALALSHVDQLENAINDYNRSIELDPYAADTYYNRGRVYADLQEYENSIKDYTTCIKLDPKNAYAYNNRGTVYAKKGEFELAINDYDNAIALMPNYATMYYNRGLAYAKLEKFESALHDMTAVISLDQSFSNAYKDRGIIYKRLGKTAEAEADFKKYEELTGSKPPSLPSP